VDQIVQVLVSGAGYGPVYWNPSFQPDTYSYVAAVSGSYPTFNYARPGVAESGRPFGLKTDVNVQAFVLAQVLVHLNGHLGRPVDDDGVMVVGHSMGSLITQAHALAYPGTTRGAILTGYLHSVNPNNGKEARENSGFAMVDEKFAGRIFDFTYLTSTGVEGRRQFYSGGDNTDPAMISWDDKTKETLTLGDVFTLGSYRATGNESKALLVPTLVVSGDEDVINCPSPVVDCTDAEAVQQFETQFYPPGCAEVLLVPDTGHDLNFHRNAMETFASILEWSLRVVGNNSTEDARRCVPDREDTGAAVLPGKIPLDRSQGVSPSLIGGLLLTFALILPLLGWATYWTKVVRPNNSDCPELSRRFCVIGLQAIALIYVIFSFCVLFLF